MSLTDLAGSAWTGTNELWLDPLGNTANTSPCTIDVQANGVRYTWSHDGTPHRGEVLLDATGGRFTDTFHSPTPMEFTRGSSSSALADLLGSYSAGEGPPWGWRIIVALRPPWEGAPESLVLQMTNITPWGEEVRAVRMTTTRSR